MAKEIVKEAATIEEAKAAAVAALGVTEDKVAFEVLQEPKAKTLGLFGGCDAIVRATVTDITPADAAVAYLKDIMAAFDRSDVEITATETENGCTINIEGEHLGFIIGRRGDTLDALQYLASLVANRQGEAYYRVTLDVGNYREKRQKALIDLAKRIAGQVVKNHRRSTLEPMSPYERRIIHTAIQEVEGVTSWSVGSEPNRRVVIGIEGDEQTGKDVPTGNRQNRGKRGGKRRDGGNNKRDNRRRDEDVIISRPVRQVRQFVSRSNPLPTAEDIAPPSRTASEKESSATLYGRIDL